MFGSRQFVMVSGSNRYHALGFLLKISAINELPLRYSVTISTFVRGSGSSMDLLVMVEVSVVSMGC